MEVMFFGEFIKHFILSLQKNGIPVKLKEQKPWHLLFYRLKHECDVAELVPYLKELRFDWDAPYPKSPELSELLNNMCIVGVLKTTSPTFEHYTLTDGMEALIESRRGILNAHEKRCLEYAVQLARKEFKEEEKRS